MARPSGSKSILSKAEIHRRLKELSSAQVEKGLVDGLAAHLEIEFEDLAEQVLRKWRAEKQIRPRLGMNPNPRMTKHHLPCEVR